MACAWTSSARPATTSMCCGDYALCRKLGFGTVRDGLRWHLIEKAPGKYDWSSWLPALEAAEQVGMQVIWDLFHYGSPDHVDQAREDFPERFTEFALAALEVQQSVSRAAAARLPAERDQLHVVGDRGRLFPAASGPTSAAGSSASWSGPASARRGRSATLIRTRPSSGPSRWSTSLPAAIAAATMRGAEAARQGQFEAYDWIIGPSRAGAWRRSVAGRRDRAELLPAQPMVLRRADDPDGPPRIPAARRHAGRGCRALRQADLPFGDGRRRVGPSRPGSTMSAARCARRWIAAPASRASAGTRSPPTPAGTIPAMPRLACFRPSRRTAAATSTSGCSPKCRRSGRCSSFRPNGCVSPAEAF